MEMHVHPSSEHLTSLPECFLSSAAIVADPAVRPASERKDGLSGEATVRSKAAGLQLEARMSAGRVCWSTFIYIIFIILMGIKWSG